MVDYVFLKQPKESADGLDVEILAWMNKGAVWKREEGYREE